MKKASAAGTVRDASEEVSEIANRKSFQAKMKTRIAAVKTPGAASGTITLRKAWNGRRPVDLGGLLEVPRDLPEEGDERVDRERQREGQVGDDQPRVGVVEAERAPHVEQRADRRDRREHRDRQGAGEDQRLAGELEAGDRVGGEARRGRSTITVVIERDQDRVDQRLDERALVDPALEQALVVVERELGREEALVGDRRPVSSATAR